MALTLTRVSDSQDYWGAVPVVFFDVALDNSYPTGGYAVTAALVGLRLIMGMKLIGISGTLANSASLLYHWDTANKKIIIFYPSGGGAASPAALAAPAITAGAVAVTSNAANGASDLTPGQGKEVANATDLSTVTIRSLFLGQR